ncbi:hypothetical protein FF38_04392 [Lucilia cuprina]|uniref:Uncharacterized protein n=1 Tax=Lucilia cuprina TaxID=7375 RepID=A0A0L0C7C1_LUCCU|nr:hypothetical protein FF38_04392 [Lucilia cuprina]
MDEEPNCSLWEGSITTVSSRVARTTPIRRVIARHKPLPAARSGSLTKISQRDFIFNLVETTKTRITTIAAITTSKTRIIAAITTTIAIISRIVTTITS